MVGVVDEPQPPRLLRIPLSLQRRGNYSPGRSWCRSYATARQAPSYRPLMENFAFQGLIGLSLAMYLWLISAGLTIIFGVLKIVNFAHGSLFMVGAYLAYEDYGQLGLPFAFVIMLSVLGTGLFTFELLLWLRECL